jgi:hypothetical protein
MEIMEDREFVEEIQRKYNIPAEYILKQRRMLGREYWIPSRKIKPEFTFETLIGFLIMTQMVESSLGWLIEDLYYSDDPHFKKKVLEIDTVAEFVYYSAIYDGVIVVFH